MDSPLDPGEVYYPIINVLSSEFSKLVGDIATVVCDLPRSRLFGLKMCVEEKLNSKKSRNTVSATITIPSSAEDLLSTIRQYWDYLNFEIVELVVDYLGIKELINQFEKYKKNVREETRKLLKYCKKERITPIEPPECTTMRMTMDVDPHSYSLHHILVAKEFLVRYMKMKVAWFAGFRQSSIILHFYILEDDRETAVHQLYEHKLELRAMQVVAIEVGDVIVYHDAPIERPPSIAAVSSQIDDLAVATETGGPIPQSINDLANTVEVGSPVVSKLQEFAPVVVTVTQQVMVVLEEIDDEEIKHNYK